jgi:drug/metabolite transporter (DMT)-like permease
MPAPESKDYLDIKAVVAILTLTLLWGLNYTAIKYANQGIAPVFASALRSIVASICGAIYCLRKGEKLFHTDIMLFHGFIVGLLFGLEFACIYFGMLYTDSARSVIFVYMSPFIVAIGAHLFLRGDRLNFSKTIGLILAFAGVCVVFAGRPKTAKATMLLGDAIEILAAVFWGATTVYIKKYMAEKIQPINTFLYQLFFSIPILLIVSLLLEPRWFYDMNLTIFTSLFYQSVIVAFVSYFVWFILIHQYSVSRLSAFTFFTPVFGVLFGVLFLNEELTLSLMVGLPMVSVGIFFVNWRRRTMLLKVELKVQSKVERK